MSGKLRIAICGNELAGDAAAWLKACQSFSDQVDYTELNLTSSTWLTDVKNAHADWYVLKPSGFTTHFKTLYDERVLIMEEELGLNIFPSRKEVFIYENKRFLSFFLKANQIPHPLTDIFYSNKEAREWLLNAEFPLVAKTNIGASGSGVAILKSTEEAYVYVDHLFSGKGARKKVGPNLHKPKLLKRVLKMLLNPKALKNRLKVYQDLKIDKQTNFVIFQEFTPHDHEWRVVRIGDSFFAHKKLKMGEKASGSLLKNYDNPPLEILDFVKEITDRYDFKSQAVDIFETSSGYLINEMQCIFGQSDPYQMLVNGEPGRYVYKNERWTFEPGDFAQNQCYDLRLEYLLNRLK